MSFAWPDIVIGGVLLLFVLKGWKRGFVSELAGFVALAIAIVAAFRYDGTIDATVAGIAHVRPGSAHVLAMVVFAAAVYALLMVVAWLLGRVAKLPVIGLGNALGGALVGAFKVALGFWALLYVALFFPLTSDLRSDLHRSALVAPLTAPNARVDAIVRDAMPWFVRPFTGPLFAHHHV